MRRTISLALRVALPVALVLCAAGQAFANDDEGQYIGYFRSGAASSNTHGVGNCYYLGNGNGHGYRMGNECDSYGEFGYAHTIATSPDGAKFVGKIMVNDYSGNTQWNGTPGIAQAYVQAEGLNWLNGGVAWVGQRYYERPDIHVMDLQYINLNGQGAGFDNIPTGALGKFSWAVFKDNDTNLGSTSNATAGAAPVGAANGSNSSIRNDFLLRGIPVNPGGTVDLVFGYISKQDGGAPDRHNGWNAHAFHTQDVLGGKNTLGAQFGSGPGTGRGDPVSITPPGLAAYQADPESATAGGAGPNSNAGLCCNRMGVAGSTLLGSGDTRTRLFDYLVIQPTKEFSSSFVALYQNDKLSSLYGLAAGNVKWTSLGARPEYAITQNFKIQGEIGFDHMTFPNAQSQHLTKLTIAPTITLGPGFYDRPELRFYITHANWSSSATAAIAANNYNSGNPFGSDTSGTTIGVRIETWFNEDWW